MNSEHSDKQVVLLLGNYRPTLTLARTLHARGYEIVVGSQGYEQVCQHSKAVSRMWEHSPIGFSPDGIAEELRRFYYQNPRLKAIYLVAEEYIRLFAENEGIEYGLPPIVTVAAETVRKCLDKPFMMRLATQLDAPTAPFAESSNSKQFFRALEHLGYPVIIRPKDSTKRFGSKKALTVGSDSLLRESVDKYKLDNQTLLLQRKFDGKRHNIYFAAINGEILRSLHAVIDRTDHPDGTGLAVEGHTLPSTGPLYDQTARFASALGYTGIGCAQFLVDEETGVSSFLEINPRIAGNHALPEYAGLDLGNFMFDLAFKNPIDCREIKGEPGIQYAWVTGDIEGLKSAYLRGEISMTTVLWSCLRVLKCGLKADVHMVYHRTDPKPAIRMLRNLLPRIMRRRLPAEQRGQDTAVSRSSGASN